MEINGFKIEKFNQYGLDEGKKLNICPLCSKDRKPENQKKKVLMCDWDRGIGTCQHCFEVLQLHTYKHVEDESKKKYFKPVERPVNNLSAKLLGWFEKRCISEYTLKNLRVGEGAEWMSQTKKDENTIQFNYYRNQKLVNTKFRDGNKNFKLIKDAERIVYNYDWAMYSSDVIMVEGEIDVLSFAECGYLHTVSCPNGSTTKNVNLDWLDNSIELFENKETIYLCFDKDEAGQNVQKELIRRLGSERCKIIDLSDCKDANEYLIKYGKESLVNKIKTAEFVPLDNIQTVRDTENDLRNFWKNGCEQGYKLGLEGLDDIFSTYLGQYTTVTGIPSHGKSEVIDAGTVNMAINYGFKTMFASPENQPYYLHQDKIARKILGEKVQNSKHNLRIDKTIEFMNDHFFWYHNSKFDLEAVLAKAAELVKRKGIKCVVIDPFNKVRLNGSLQKNVNDYTNDYHCKIDEFCKKYNVIVFLIAHPNKMKKDIGSNKYPIPDFYDIKGGGEHYDMSYHGLSVYRDFEGGFTAVKVLKVKFANLGETGKTAYFAYNLNNGRYTGISNPDDDPNALFNAKHRNYFLLDDTVTQPEIRYEMQANTEFDFEQRSENPPF